VWKWIGGILVLIVLCLAGASWLGYKRITAGGDAASVTIAGSPERIFATLANHDSLPDWWVLKGEASPTGHGPLAVGDSLPIQTPQSSRRRLSRWVTDEVVPGKLLVLSLHNDSAGVVVAVQRDSLVSLGDSTQIISTISSPMMDNLRSQNGAEKQTGGAVMDMSSKLVVSAMRLQSKLELTRLKNHIEGRSGRPCPTATSC
jgi:uncharacterized protein YndB with AHSA1/START domain